MQQREAIDPAHAFYLGYEMAKAVTALTLGKNYVQDQALRWGFLTAAEVSHRGAGEGVMDSTAVVEEPRSRSPAWDVARKLSDLPHLLFLDSALPASPLGRYSFVAADPFALC